MMCIHEVVVIDVKFACTPFPVGRSGVDISGERFFAGISGEPLTVARSSSSCGASVGLDVRELDRECVPSASSLRSASSSLSNLHPEISHH